VLTGESIEPYVRRVVARRLGVPASALQPTVSLRDDLATDDGAMTDLVLAVESRLGVRMPDQILDEVRTYGELVAAAVKAIRERRVVLAKAGEEAARARIRLTGPGDRIVERAGRLTPYVIESIKDDARRSGPGTTIAITVTDPVAPERLDDLRGEFEDLERRGASVRIVRAAARKGS
jgi:acyl carrier protein